MIDFQSLNVNCEFLSVSAATCRIISTTTIAADAMGEKLEQAVTSLRERHYGVGFFRLSRFVASNPTTLYSLLLLLLDAMGNVSF